MCGFVGYFSNQNYNLDNASKSILHRGPDMQSISKGHNWSVAFNRLSIIDLSENAMQPFKYKNVSVFINGEIYNYLELKKEFEIDHIFKTKSDVEVIPLLYLKYGIKFLNKINGFFSMVIIDGNKNKSFLIRDRYGKKPLYFYKVNNSIFFSSEIKSLKHIIKLKENKIALASNLCSWFLCGNLSLYKNVFNVNPGSYLEVESNFKTHEIKWYLPKIYSQNYSYEEIKENFNLLFSNSIKLRLRSDVDVGIFLSGGLDSMSINHSLEKHSKKRTSKFIAIIEGKEKIEKNTTDTEILDRFLKDKDSSNFIIKINADYYNNNIVKIVSNYERLFVNSGALLFYALSEKAREENVKVIMTGAGGDEVFGGYIWQKPPTYFPESLFKLFLNKNNSNNFRFLINFFENKFSHKTIWLNLIYRFIFQTKSWHAQSLSPYFQSFFNDENDEVVNLINNISEDYFDYSLNLGENDVHNKINFANIYTTINSQLYDSDMGTMNYSIENRAPFLDHNLFEYMLSIPTKLKYTKSAKTLQKKLLKNTLPDYVLEGKKSGPTMPINLWFEELNKNGGLFEFINKNNYLIAELISEKLYWSIKEDVTLIFKHQCLPAFAIISFLLWAKINVENSISDKSIPLLEIR